MSTDRGKIDAWVQTTEAIVVNREAGFEEAKGSSEEDHSNVDKLTAVDVAYDANERIALPALLFPSGSGLSLRGGHRWPSRPRPVALAGAPKGRVRMPPVDRQRLKIALPA